MLKTKKTINFLSGWPHSKKKKKFIPRYASNNGFPVRQNENAIVSDSWAWKSKKISKPNGARMFFAPPFPLQDDGGGRLFYPRPVPSKKKKTLHTGKGFPDFLNAKPSSPV